MDVPVLQWGRFQFSDLFHNHVRLIACEPVLGQNKVSPLKGSDDVGQLCP